MKAAAKRGDDEHDRQTDVMAVRPPAILSGMRRWASLLMAAALGCLLSGRSEAVLLSGGRGGVPALQSSFECSPAFLAIPTGFGGQKCRNDPVDNSDPRGLDPQNVIELNMSGIASPAYADGGDWGDPSRYRALEWSGYAAVGHVAGPVVGGAADLQLNLSDIAGAMELARGADYRTARGWLEGGVAMVGGVALVVDAVGNLVPGKAQAEAVVKQGVKTAVETIAEVGSKAVVRESAQVARWAAKNADELAIAGRQGKQARLRELVADANVSSADRGWIQQEINSIERGQRTNIRVAPGKNLAHRRGFEAKKGYSYEHSDLQDVDLHKLQHKHEGY